MNPIDSELEAFFRATEAPVEDDAFVWRVLETYERRTRAGALASAAARAAGMALFAMIAIALLTEADSGAQAALAGGLRSLIAFGAFLAAAGYAARTMGGGAPLNLAAL